MKIIIVGGSETAVTLVNLLGSEHECTVIEADKDAAEAFAKRTDALVVNGDGTTFSVLKEAGIDEVDALVAATSDDKTNLLICEIAMTEKVAKVISLVNTSKNEEIFTRLGIHFIVSVTGTNAVDIKKLLLRFGAAKIVYQMGNGEAQVIEITVAEKSELIGKPASIPHAIIAAIYRSGEIIIPNGSSVLAHGDVLLVSTTTKNLQSVVSLISPK